VASSVCRFGWQVLATGLEWQVYLPVWSGKFLYAGLGGKFLYAGLGGKFLYANSVGKFSLPFWVPSRFF